MFQYTPAGRPRRGCMATSTITVGGTIPPPGSTHHVSPNISSQNREIYQNQSQRLEDSDETMGEDAG